MSKPVNYVACLRITEGKVERAKSLLEPLIKSVYANESGCARYNMHVSADGKDIVFIETYNSPEDVQIHINGDEFKKFFGAVKEEGLFREEPMFLELNEVAGFESRAAGLYGF